jgi:hypothetical protein
MKLFPIKVRWNIYPYIEQLRKLNKTKNSTHFNTTHNMYTLKFRKLDVATPLWAKCEGEAHTPKSGNLESSGTPENSELELKGQNTSHWGVLCVIGKVLKCRCLNWPRIGHLDICSPSYEQKKGQESNWQFDSRPLKVGNRPLPDVCSESATWRWKALKERYNIGLDLAPIRLGSREIWAPKVPGLQLGQFRDSFGTSTWESQEKEPFGCSLGGDLQRILQGGRWWLPPSPGRGESSESELACG